MERVAMHLVRDWGCFSHQSPRVYRALYLGEVIMCGHYVVSTSVSCICDTSVVFPRCIIVDYYYNVY